jgi:hypothetical protein
MECWLQTCRRELLGAAIVSAAQRQIGHRDDPVGDSGDYLSAYRLGSEPSVCGSTGNYSEAWCGQPLANLSSITDNGQVFSLTYQAAALTGPSAGSLRDRARPATTAFRSWS